jgi:hypothetical protein
MNAITYRARMALVCPARNRKERLLFPDCSQIATQQNHGSVQRRTPRKSTYLLCDFLVAIDCPHSLYQARAAGCIAAVLIKPKRTSDLCALPKRTCLEDIEQSYKGATVAREGLQARLVGIRAKLFRSNVSPEVFDALLRWQYDISKMPINWWMVMIDPDRFKPSFQLDRVY